jgi:hypothetical protein
MDMDDRGSPDINHTDYDYDAKGLDVLVTYQEGQDHLFHRHGERGARALKCPRRLVEMKKESHCDVHLTATQGERQEMILR